MQNHMNIAKLRIKNNLTCNNLADLLNVSLSTYKYYESGLVPMTLKEINILSNYYNVSFDYLLGISKKTTIDHFKEEIDYNYLKFCLRYLRRRTRINQKKFGKELNYSTHSISKFEHDGTLVKIDYLIKMSKKFQISSDYICGVSLKMQIL